MRTASHSVESSRARWAQTPTRTPMRWRRGATSCTTCAATSTRISTRRSRISWRRRPRRHRWLLRRIENTNPPDAEVQRKARAPTPLRITPHARQRRGKIVERIPSGLLAEDPHGRPGIDVAEKLAEIPFGFHPEARHGDFLEGEWKLVVGLLDVHSLVWPIRPDHVGVEVYDERVDHGVDLGQRVAPECDDGARARDASHLRVEALEVEPVDRLRDGDEIDHGALEAGVLGHGDAILDPRVRARLRDLLPARVG